MNFLVAIIILLRFLHRDMYIEGEGEVRGGGVEMGGVVGRQNIIDRDYDFALYFCQSNLFNCFQQ